MPDDPEELPAPSRLLPTTKTMELENEKENGKEVRRRVGYCRRRSPRTHGRTARTACGTSCLFCNADPALAPDDAERWVRTLEGARHRHAQRVGGHGGAGAVARGHAPAEERRPVHDAGRRGHRHAQPAPRVRCFAPARHAWTNSPRAVRRPTDDANANANRCAFAPAGHHLHMGMTSAPPPSHTPSPSAATAFPSYHGFRHRALEGVNNTHDTSYDFDCELSNQYDVLAHVEDANHVLQLHLQDDCRSGGRRGGAQWRGF
ncbi:hypothetical protein FB451DRAFT_1394012 [Mycena latifolia]|nr:hypothetical protein FB451DRAFT_1394012 [Mycena latifolia]